MDLQPFNRFLIQIFRKLVLFRSELFEEAEVPHLLQVKQATFNEDKKLISKSLHYMEKHLDNKFHLQVYKKIVSIFSKIEELRNRYWKECLQQNNIQCQPSEVETMKELNLYFDIKSKQSFESQFELFSSEEQEEEVSEMSNSLHSFLQIQQFFHP